LIALGLGLLRLSPRDFWSMTPREAAIVLRLMMGDAPAPPQRTALAALMSLFPDRKHERRQ